MVLRELDTILKKYVITQDAFMLGEVMDIRYDPSSWDIVGLKVKTGSTVVSMLSVGSTKSLILLEPGKYIFNDVILMPDKIESARVRITADNANISAISYLVGKKVISLDGVLIGTVDSIDIDTDKWRIVSMKLKLDKNSCSLLGVKKGIFAKRVSGILMTHIESISENINLAINVDSIKTQIVIIN